MTLSRQSVAIVVVLGLLISVHTCAGQSVDAIVRHSGPPAAGQVPLLVNFAGELKGYEGRPATGVAGITFLLYEEEEGGSPLWCETQNVAVDAEGRYSVMLGAATPDGLPSELFTAKQARWLAIEPQGLPSPARVMLVSVPYALKAGDAETIGGLPASAFLRAPTPQQNDSALSPLSANSVSAATTSGSGTVNFIPRWTPNGSTLGNSVLFQAGTGSAAKVGINSATPAATLDVNGSVIARGSLQLPSRAAATGAKGAISQPLTLQASVFSGSTHTAVGAKFQWQAEPSGNNTANPGATLNLLYGPGTPTETGLSIAGNGKITFASGQSFPGAGTVTGIAAGAGLAGGGSSGKLTLSIDATKVPLLNAANTFTGPITFAPGQTFPGVGTLTGIAAGAGLTGGGTTGNPTLSIDITKVPLLSSANTFTAPMTFAPGQTFPGTGTITGITAGSGLSGGGTSGTVTLNLNTTYSDGRYAQLGANNTFSGIQNFNSYVGIGISAPAYPLHVMGAIRSESGLSLGGNAPVMVDAPGIIGGRLAILGNGRVGINSSNPSTTLDVGGNINSSGSLNGASLSVSGGITANGNAKIGGTLQINGDQPMSAAPHMYLTGYVPGPMAALTSEVAIVTIPSKSILITRMIASGLSTCPQAGSLTFDIAERTATLHTLTLSSDPSADAVDSGPLSIPISAGTPFWGRVNPPNCGPFGSAPSQIAVTIEYVMQ